MKTSLSIRLAFLFSFGQLIFAQDSLVIMQYNLLRYGASALSEKNSFCLPVIDYVNPDILCVNEVLPDYTDSLELSLKLLDSSWIMAPWSNVSGGTVVNVLFYKRDKITFIKQRTVQTLVRDIPVYWLMGPDSIQLTIAVAHLKAGSNSTSEQQRRWMVEALIDSLNSWNVDRWILTGDLNFYTAEDTSYKLLTNHPDPRIRVVDPLPAGQWNNNVLFALYHTQSTRDTLLSDGGATGGMDDRFDFILPSVRYYEPPYQWDTFYVFAQDGNHFNKSILDSPALPVPDTIATALYFCSDHLPVIAVLSLPTNQNQDTIISIPSPNHSTNCYLLNDNGQIMTTVKHCSKIINITTIDGRQIYVNSHIALIDNKYESAIFIITYEHSEYILPDAIKHVKVIVK